MRPVSLLRAANLTAGYGAAPAIEAVDLDVAAGDYVGIVGPNGSGKTTLLRALLGLLPARTGEIALWGAPLAEFRDWRRIGYLPQAAQLPFRRFPADVREVVASGRLAHLRFPKRLGPADRDTVERALDLLDLRPLARRMIGELSGGQFQRVCLARVLADETGAQLLPLHSMHNVTKEDLASGATYFTLMRRNLENLRAGLGCAP